MGKKIYSGKDFEDRHRWDRTKTDLGVNEAIREASIYLGEIRQELDILFLLMCA